MDPLSAFLMATVVELSSARYQGRLAGDAGYDQAAAWAEQRFRAAGLEPFEEDLQQRLPIEVNRIRACSLDLPDTPMRLALGDDYACRGMTGAADITAPTVFVGYGITEGEWDDYAGVDARGKVVVALKQDPPWLLGGRPWGERWLARAKARNAMAHGAVGLLLVSRTDADGKAVQRPIGSLLDGEGPHLAGFPAMQVDLPVAEALLGPGSISTLQGRIDTEKTPLHLDSPYRVHLRVEAAYDPEGRTSNVVATLPGADPLLRDTWVVVGAHLDHVGYQGAVVWPGANDNASGVAGVLAIAERMASASKRQARSVAFVLFASEEHHLDGARYFVEHLPFPPDHVVAMIDLDCIGDGKAIQVGGGGASPRLWDLARKADVLQGRTHGMVDDTWYGGGADAQPFFDAGIPTLFFVAWQGYSHLHRPTDTPDTLNPDLLQSQVELAYSVVARIAEGAYDREERAPDE